MSKRVNNKKGNRAKRKGLNQSPTTVRARSKPILYVKQDNHLFNSLVNFEYFKNISSKLGTMLR